MREKILEEYAKGNIVFNTVEGPQIMKFEEFIDQPIEGMLYDLNRDDATILTFIDKDPKWINDYALTQLIKYLHKKLHDKKTT